jgi:hypothetical protein
LAAMNRRVTVTRADFELAHELLVYTESLMPMALGEYGVSNESRIRQQIIDYLSNQTRMLSFNELHEQLQHSCPKRSDFMRIVEELVQGNKIRQYTNHYDETTGGSLTRYGPATALFNEEQRATMLAELRGRLNQTQ